VSQAEVIYIIPVDKISQQYLKWKELHTLNVAIQSKNVTRVLLLHQVGVAE